MDGGEDFSEKGPAPMFKRRNRNQRQMANVRAQMRLDDEWIPVVVANASSTGLMIKCADPPAIGTQVEIRHRGLGITGEVIWSSRARFGMRSDAEIDLAALFAQADFRPRSGTIDAPIRDAKWWHWRSRR